MARVDPQNTALRWGVVVSHRIYQVPWPNSLWHLHGHHALIRWKIIIHGCIDGFSRRIMFLRRNSNNLAETALVLFLDAIKHDGNLWPSRIRVDKGVELSTEMGADIYTEALDLVLKRLEQLADSGTYVPQ